MAKRTNTAVWIEKYDRWQINVQKDGKRKTFSSSKAGRTGQREANAKADAWLEDNIENQSTKVSELFKGYLDELKLRTSQSHWRMEESRWNTWIEPEIGRLKISVIGEKHLQNIINKAYSEGKLAKKSLTGIRATLSAFMKYCRKQKVTTFRPEDIIIPRGAAASKKKILQPDELKILFTEDTTLLYGNRIYDDYVNAFRFQVLNGLRPGELLGLRFSDIENNVLNINRSINIYGEETTGKNENALRPIALNELSQRIINEQWERSQGEEERVFYAIASEDNYRQRWQKYCEVNCITYVTPYELRHTFVSIAKNLGTGQLKQLVGHSANMDTYGTYSHEIKGELERSAEQLNNIFNNILNKEDKQ